MRALIVVIVALLSAPAFGDGKLAVDLGFGGLKPTQAERFDPNVPSEKPPLPRARPKDREDMPAWEREYWASRGGIPDEVQRELEEWERDPETAYERDMREAQERLEKQRMMQRLREAGQGAPGVDI